MNDRHPLDRVTPVEVGDPLRWSALAHGFEGRTEARGCWYVVRQLDDVWVAEVLGTVLGHGGERQHRVALRHCVDPETARAACQDAEHLRAWSALSEVARGMLLGVSRFGVPA